MRASRGIGARLCVVGLVLAASLPGPLQLAHEHAGGERAHIHLDAAELAARALFDDHAHPHQGAHGRHAHGPTAPHDGAHLEAADAHHVHALSPFQRAARSASLDDRPGLVASPAPKTWPVAPATRTWHAARSRGPPALLAG